MSFSEKNRNYFLGTYLNLEIRYKELFCLSRHFGHNSEARSIFYTGLHQPTLRHCFFINISTFFINKGVVE